jgi:hypothetical protein
VEFPEPPISEELVVLPEELPEPLKRDGPRKRNPIRTPATTNIVTIVTTALEFMQEPPYYFCTCTITYLSTHIAACVHYT